MLISYIVFWMALFSASIRNLLGNFLEEFSWWNWSISLKHWDGLWIPSEENLRAMNELLHLLICEKISLIFLDNFLGDSTAKSKIVPIFF